MAFPLGKILGKVIKVLPLIKAFVDMISRKQSDEDETKVIWRDGE